MLGLKRLFSPSVFNDDDLIAHLEKEEIPFSIDDQNLITIARDIDLSEVKNAKGDITLSRVKKMSSIKTANSGSLIMTELEDAWGIIATNAKK